MSYADLRQSIDITSFYVMSLLPQSYIFVILSTLLRFDCMLLVLRWFQKSAHKQKREQVIFLHVFDTTQLDWLLYSQSPNSRRGRLAVGHTSGPESASMKDTIQNQSGSWTICRSRGCTDVQPATSIESPSVSPYFHTRTTCSGTSCLRRWWDQRVVLHETCFINNRQ